MVFRDAAELSRGQRVSLMFLASCACHIITNITHWPAISRRARHPYFFLFFFFFFFLLHRNVRPIYACTCATSAVIYVKPWLGQAPRLGTDATLLACRHARVRLLTHPPYPLSVIIGFPHGIPASRLGGCIRRKADSPSWLLAWHDNDESNDRWVVGCSPDSDDTPDQQVILFVEKLEE